MSKQTIGQRIFTIRTARKLTRREVVATAGVTEATLYNIEQLGQQPSIANLQAIARVLGVTAGALLGEA